MHLSTDRPPSGFVKSLRYLEACVEVSVQPLHDEQHSDAGPVSIGVIDHGAVQIDETLVLGQSPAKERERKDNNNSVT